MQMVGNSQPHFTPSLKYRVRARVLMKACSVRAAKLGEVDERHLTRVRAERELIHTLAPPQEIQRTSCLLG